MRENHIDIANDRFLRLPAVQDKTGLSKRTIYRRMSQGTFPKKVQISANAVAWRESAITGWMASIDGPNGE